MSLDSEGLALFHVQLKGKAITVTPQRIGGYIIAALQQTMAKNLTFSTPNLAVVSVPAEFNQLQRNHTSRRLMSTLLMKSHL